MAKKPTTLKRLEYEAEGKKMVDQLIAANKHQSTVAVFAINTVITAYLTEKEIRDILIKLVNRSKSARSTVAFTLTKI